MIALSVFIFRKTEQVYLSEERIDGYMSLILSMLIHTDIHIMTMISIRLKHQVLYHTSEKPKREEILCSSVEICKGKIAVMLFF